MYGRTLTGIINPDMKPLLKPEPLKNTGKEDSYKSKAPKKKGSKRKTHQRK